MQTLRERLIGVLAHSVPCMTLNEFKSHAVIHEDGAKVLQELNLLVQDGLFECGVTTYLPKYGETLYYKADNDGAEEAFNMVRAQG